MTSVVIKIQVPSVCLRKECTSLYGMVNFLTDSYRNHIIQRITIGKTELPNNYLENIKYCLKNNWGKSLSDFLKNLEIEI